MDRMEERIPETLDNKESGRVVEELREDIQTGSRISLIAAEDSETGEEDDENEEAEDEE